MRRRISLLGMIGGPRGLLAATRADFDCRIAPPAADIAVAAQGAVIDADLQDTLPATTDLRLIAFTVYAIGASGEACSVVFTGDLGDPPIGMVAVHGGWLKVAELTRRRWDCPHRSQPAPRLVPRAHAAG